MRTCVNCLREFPVNDIAIARCTECKVDVCQDCERIIYSTDMRHEKRVCPNCFMIEIKYMKEEQSTYSEFNISRGYYENCN